MNPLPASLSLNFLVPLASKPGLRASSLKHYAVSFPCKLRNFKYAKSKYFTLLTFYVSRNGPRKLFAAKNVATPIFFHFNFNLNFFPRSKKILPGKWIHLSAGILRCSERLALKSGHYTVKILFVPDYTYLNLLSSQAVQLMLTFFFYLSELTPSSFRSTGCHFFHIALHPRSEKTFRKSRDWPGSSSTTNKRSYVCCIF